MIGPGDILVGIVAVGIVSFIIIGALPELPTTDKDPEVSTDGK